MKFAMTKIAAAAVLAFAVTGAQAADVIKMTLDDTINAATNALGTDGKEGAFRFAPISLTTFQGASPFTGNVNNGVINLAGASANSLDPSNAFTTGFVFAGSNFGPNTTGPIVADVSTGGVLTFSSLPWGGYYSGAAFQFNMPADAYTVNNLIYTGTNALGQKDYAYRVSFNHTITEADDPSFTYVGMTAYWVAEGTVTAVPEASTYGMMLAGLGLIGGMVARRRKTMA